MDARSEDIAGVLAAGKGGGRRRWIVAAAFVAAVLVGGLGYWRLSGSGGGVSYVTEPAVRGPLTVTVIATGTVQPTREVDISSELSGTLIEVAADYNDEV